MGLHSLHPGSPDTFAVAVSVAIARAGRGRQGLGDLSGDRRIGDSAGHRNDARQAALSRLPGRPVSGEVPFSASDREGGHHARLLVPGHGAEDLVGPGHEVKGEGLACAGRI